MKTIQVNLYQFDELENKVRDKVLIDELYINVEDNWWEAVYEDAKNIGLKLTGFDIDRAQYCTGEWMRDALFTAGEVTEQHGENTPTFLATKLFWSAQNDLLATCPKDGNGEPECPEAVEDQMDTNEANYLKHLLRLYLQMLNKEYDYLVSDTAIRETIEVNQYWFTADGERADKLERLQLNHLKQES
jgi:hypothetical protein